MAGRGTVGALLVSGLVAVIAIGGAGGYGVGLSTTAERSDAATGAAAPLGSLQPLTPSPTVGSTPTPPPSAEEDRAGQQRTAQRGRPPLQDPPVHRDQRGALGGQPPGPGELELHPAGSPEDRPLHRPDRQALAAGRGRVHHPPVPRRLDGRKARGSGTVPANQMLSIKSQTVDPDTHGATLVYTYVPDNSVRYVVVRWVANGDGLCTFEIAVTGLPQDQAALEDVLQHAADSAVRDDSPISDRVRRLGPCRRWPTGLGGASRLVTTTPPGSSCRPPRRLRGGPLGVWVAETGIYLRNPPAVGVDPNAAQLVGAVGCQVVCR